MRWFQGEIAAGIEAAKKRKTLFVVYVRNDSEESKKMDLIWESPEVAKICEQFGFVIMRFQADSNECQMFSQFYPVLVIPSVSFISGETGVLLEGTAGSESADQFIQRIKKVVQTTTRSSSSPTPTGSPSPAQAPASAIPPTNAPEQKENNQDKAARMRKKMEEVHAKKEARKKQAVYDTELERRKVGQEMQKSRQIRDDDEAKKLVDHIRREKMEDKIAKQKVMEQIARDRAEKEVRFAATKKEQELRKAAGLVRKEESRRAEESAKTAAKMDTARIQFRLPDGSKILHQFPSTATLQEAHQFLTEEIGDTFKEFSMSTTFPRRRFGTGDMQTSLLDLQLVPSAAVTVLPGSPSSSDLPSRAVSTNEGGIIAMLFAPFLFIWNLLYTFIFGTATTQNEPDQSYVPESSASSSQDQAYQNMGARPKSSYARRRTPASSGAESISKKDGNVHTLNKDDDDDDDDNRTWNGNSTQQM